MTNPVDFPDAKITFEQRRRLKEYVQWVEEETEGDSNVLMYLSCAFEDAARRAREREERTG